MKDRKAYMKAWKEAHKEEAKAWREAHKESEKAYQKAYREAHKASMKAYYQAHKEDYKAYQKAYRQAHKEEAKAYKQAHKEEVKAYMKSDLNANGQTKHSIRQKSRAILKQMNLKIPHYEIHHCFGYEDASKFIYISRSLHLKIHQFLRDNNIDASNDHWMQIRDLVNSTDEFMYIKC